MRSVTMHPIFPFRRTATTALLRTPASRMGLSWPAVEAALTTDPHRLPPALLADVQRHLEGLVFGPASQQPLNLSWSPPRFECETPRPAGQPPRRIIDVVPFSYELDVLELRLHELNATVDLFVVVEAPITHRGKPSNPAAGLGRSRVRQQG